MENYVQGLKSLVEEAKLRPRKALDGGEVMTDEMKRQISEIKSSFLSVIDEVDSAFSNDAANLLIAKLEHISRTIKEIENVLKHDVKKTGSKLHLNIKFLEGPFANQTIKCETYKKRIVFGSLKEVNDAKL